MTNQEIYESMTAIIANAFNFLSDLDLKEADIEYISNELYDNFSSKSDNLLCRIMLSNTYREIFEDMLKKYQSDETRTSEPLNPQDADELTSHFSFRETGELINILMDRLQKSDDKIVVFAQCGNNDSDVVVNRVFSNILKHLLQKTNKEEKKEAIALLLNSM